MPDECCLWMTSGGSYLDPAEYCGDPVAADGQPYCAEHGRLADG